MYNKFEIVRLKKYKNDKRNYIGRITAIMANADGFRYFITNKAFGGTVSDVFFDTEIEKIQE